MSLYNEYFALKTEQESLERQAKEYEGLKKALSSSECKLASEEKTSALVKAFLSIRLPFSRKYIKGLFRTAWIMLLTIALSIASPFVLLAGLFCITVDAAWVVIYVLLSPFISIYFAINRSERIAKCREDYELCRKEVEDFDIDLLNASIEKCIKRIEEIESERPGFRFDYEIHQEAKRNPPIYVDFVPPEDELPIFFSGNY